MNSIIPRVPGLNNKEMLKRCELLYGVVSKTYDTIEGKGKNTTLKKAYKFDVPSDTMQKIKNSIEYYKNNLDKQK